MKQVLVKGDEYDTVSWMRQYLCYLARPGATSRVKRRLRRRSRRGARDDIRRGRWDSLSSM